MEPHNGAEAVYNRAGQGRAAGGRGGTRTWSRGAWGAKEKGNEGRTKCSGASEEGSQPGSCGSRGGQKNKHSDEEIKA